MNDKILSYNITTNTLEFIDTNDILIAYSCKSIYIIKSEENDETSTSNTEEKV